MKTIEYRVRPVTRYIVTEYVISSDWKAPHNATIGEYASKATAERVAEAFFVDAEAVERGNGCGQEASIICHDGSVSRWFDGKMLSRMTVGDPIDATDGPYASGVCGSDIAKTLKEGLA